MRKLLDERFWSKVDKNSSIYGADGDYPSACWQWIGAKMTSGYGNIRINGKNHHAHRVLFQLKGIVLSSKDCVLHKCDNRACVNPDHLTLGSRRDNARDMAKKGRAKGAIGTNNTNSKLTPDIVRLIRKEAGAGATYQELATRFGVTRPTISYLMLGQTWKHVA